MVTFLVVSSLFSFVIGLILKNYEENKVVKSNSNSKRLSALKVVSSLCLAYPFCALFVWVDRNIEQILK